MASHETAGPGVISKESDFAESWEGEENSGPEELEARDALSDSSTDKALRDQLSRFLDWDSAHLRFDDAVKDFPPHLRGIRPPAAPHSAWELLEHLRITLWDIVEFSRDPKHKSPAWPSGYWPATAAPPNDAAWNESIAAYRDSLRALSKLASDHGNDLYARIPHGDGQTLLREVLLAADHNAYHVGQLVMVRRMLAPS